MAGILFLVAIFAYAASERVLIISLGSGEDRYLSYQSSRILSTSGLNVTLIISGDPGPRIPGVDIVIIPTRPVQEAKVANDDHATLQTAHLQRISRIAAENLEICETLYRDNLGLKIVQRADYDLAIVFLTFSDACVLPLMKVVNVPVIGLSTSQIDHPWVYYHSSVPYPLSYIPVLSEHNPRDFSTIDKLGNFRRWWNYLSAVENSWQNPAIKIAENGLKQTFDLKSLYGNLGVVLTSSDLLMDHPIPTPPHIIHAGCFYCLPPLEYEGISKEFVENVRSGVVFITTNCPLDGAHAESPTGSTQVLIDAVLNAGYSAIITTNDPKMREHRPRPGVLYLRNPSRTDILGHPKTKLMISRCSFTETFESLYYGVPILCIPTSAAQRLATNRAVELGAAERWQWNKLVEVGANETQEMIVNLIRDKSYREGLRHISQDVRDRPLTPLDVFIYWVNYAIRHHGHTHLRSDVATSLSTASYYLIDVIVMIVLSIVGLLVGVSILMIVIARFYLVGKKSAKDKFN